MLCFNNPLSITSFSPSENEAMTTKYNFVNYQQKLQSTEHSQIERTLSTVGAIRLVYHIRLPQY